MVVGFNTSSSEFLTDIEVFDFGILPTNSNNEYSNKDNRDKVYREKSYEDEGHVAPSYILVGDGV
jgi:hypothetical protein